MEGRQELLLCSYRQIAPNQKRKTLAKLLKTCWAFCVFNHFQILAGRIEFYVIISFPRMPLMPRSSVIDRELTGPSPGLLKLLSGKMLILPSPFPSSGLLEMQSQL